MKDQDHVFDLLVAANPVPDPRARPDGFEAEAPMRRVPGEDRPIERRRPARWWLNPGVAVATALAVVAGFSLFLLGRGSGQDSFPAGTPTTTSPDISPTTVAPAPPPGLGFVVATDEGVEMIDARGTITRIARGGASVALDDGIGGVVYQPSQGSGEADPSVSAAAAIVHVPDGAGPEVLVSDLPGVSLSRLYDVVEIDGRTVVVFVEFRNPGEISETGEWLVEYDLRSGAIREVAQVARSERAVEAVSWDGSRYVVETLGDGLALFSTVTRDGTVEPWSGALPAECTTAGPCPRLRVATPDGERLVLVDGDDLVVWNRTTDSAETILQGEAGDDVRGLRVEGQVLVVNREGASATVYDLSALKLDPVPVAGFADPVLDMPFFPSNVPGEAERQAAAEAARARELAELRIDGQAVDAVACAGVDGAVVYRPATESGLTFIVGFEEGVFVRVLGDGVETETDQVMLMDRADGTRLAIADLEVAGDLVTVEAVVVDGLPECTP